MYDIIIVGGGIVGLATAYQLSQKIPKGSKKILVLEKEPSLAFHQTGHNSGVIHSGIYYKPGSLRASNCYKGRTALIEFSKKYGINHDMCGKVIVAAKNSEVPYLEEIHRRGVANKTPDLQWLNTPEEIKEHEPYCEGVKAVFVGSAGIINYREVAEKYAELFREWGGEIKTSTRVTAFDKQADHTLVVTEKGNFKAKHFIACGGSQSDRLAKSDELDPGMRIVGFRGEYYELVNKEKVKNLIYPVPDPAFPWLGVHFTRMIDGSVECGPNAVYAFKRDGYRKTDFNWKDTKDAITYKGFWKLITSHVAYGIKEQYRSISKRAFLKSLQGLMPSLKMEDIEPGRAGVRALALAPDGNMLDDFKFVYNDNSIHVLNAPSPAATASLAVGDTISGMAVERFNIT